MIARRIRVAGRVQGVFFRNWTVGEARALGLAGWVRNRADGSVEVHAEGPEVAVETLLARLHEGPPAARVAAVEPAPADVEGLTAFEQRPTG